MRSRTCWRCGTSRRRIRRRSEPGPFGDLAGELLPVDPQHRRIRQQLAGETLRRAAAAEAVAYAHVPSVGPVGVLRQLDVSDHVPRSAGGTEPLLTQGVLFGHALSLHIRAAR